MYIDKYAAYYTRSNKFFSHTDQLGIVNYSNESYVLNFRKHLTQLRVCAIISKSNDSYFEYFG